MQIPIHVAIPSYNNAAGLKILLAQLTRQDFATITVLDDASTDETQQIIGAFSRVNTIRSEINLGTVGANNLILQAMPEDGFLLCIDSDMTMGQHDTPERLSNFLKSHPGTAIGVGKIIDEKTGERIRWNFNYDINPFRSLLAFLTYHPARLLHAVPVVGSFFQNLSCVFVQHFAPDVAQKVDWGD
jgi:GT2 family glycosyltransferase